MKMISRIEHCAARQKKGKKRKKNTRQKSISPDNPRLTARTSLERNTPRDREGEHREESAKTALEIIVVITRSCWTRSPTADIKGKRERKRRGESCPRIQYPCETCPDFIEKRRERERERGEERASQGESAAARSPVLHHGPAGLNLVDYFVWGCRRQMVGSRERERINFRESAPPGCVLPLAREEGNGNAEKR